MAQSPAALLQQIDSLVKEYVALGDDTPLYQDFKELEPKLQSGISEEKGESASDEAAEQAPEEAGETPAQEKSEMMNPSGAEAKESPTSFGEARALAGEALRRGNLKPKAKKGAASAKVQAMMQRTKA